MKHPEYNRLKELVDWHIMDFSAGNRTQEQYAVRCDAIQPDGRAQTPADLYFCSLRASLRRER